MSEAGKRLIAAAKEARRMVCEYGKIGTDCWCPDCAPTKAALASKDAEIERLRALIGEMAGYVTNMYGDDGVIEDIAKATQAAGATPQPRSEVSGSETPGNHSGDPE